MQNIHLLIRLSVHRKSGFLVNSFPTRLTSALTQTPCLISEVETQTSDVAGKKKEKKKKNEKKEGGFKPGIEQLFVNSEFLIDRITHSLA